jgi:chromatin segregation and condensation protein Rec8/ScpA/Scc1 (kleisin family)
MGRTVATTLAPASAGGRLPTILEDAMASSVPAIPNRTQAAINDILSNDEASSDEELISHFMAELQLTAAQAVEQVSRRDQMLGCMCAAWPIKGK